MWAFSDTVNGNGNISNVTIEAGNHKDMKLIGGVGGGGDPGTTPGGGGSRHSRRSWSRRLSSSLRSLRYMSLEDGSVAVGGDRSSDDEEESNSNRNRRHNNKTVIVNATDNEVELVNDMTSFIGVVDNNRAIQNTATSSSAEDDIMISDSEDDSDDEEEEESDEDIYDMDDDDNVWIGFASAAFGTTTSDHQDAEECDDDIASVTSNDDEEDGDSSVSSKSRKTWDTCSIQLDDLSTVPLTVSQHALFKGSKLVESKVAKPDPVLGTQDNDGDDDDNSVQSITMDDLECLNKLMHGSQLTSFLNESMVSIDNSDCTPSGTKTIITTATGATIKMSSLSSSPKMKSPGANSVATDSTKSNSTTSLSSRSTDRYFPIREFGIDSRRGSTNSTRSANTETRSTIVLERKPSLQSSDMNFNKCNATRRSSFSDLTKVTTINDGVATDAPTSPERRRQSTSSSTPRNSHLSKSSSNISKYEESFVSSDMLNALKESSLLLQRSSSTVSRARRASMEDCVVTKSPSFQRFQQQQQLSRRSSLPNPLNRNEIDAGNSRSSIQSVLKADNIGGTVSLSTMVPSPPLYSPITSISKSTQSQRLCQRTIPPCSPKPTSAKSKQRRGRRRSSSSSTRTARTAATALIPDESSSSLSTSNTLSPVSKIPKNNVEIKKKEGSSIRKTRRDNSCSGRSTRTAGEIRARRRDSSRSGRSTRTTSNDRRRDSSRSARSSRTSSFHQRMTSIEFEEKCREMKVVF